nr:hypothetical protein GCM10010200_042400 [Actinomadura rugatobispora]
MDERHELDFSERARIAARRSRSRASLGSVLWSAFIRGAPLCMAALDPPRRAVARGRGVTRAARGVRDPAASVAPAQPPLLGGPARPERADRRPVPAPPAARIYRAKVVSRKESPALPGDATRDLAYSLARAPFAR